MTSILPLKPARLRDNMARGVRCCPYCLAASITPGISWSSIGRTASGITSRGEGPVPPVKRSRSKGIQIHFFTDHLYLIAFSPRETESEQTTTALLKPAVRKIIPTLPFAVS
jgi:hypothetical protein